MIHICNNTFVVLMFHRFSWIRAAFDICSESIKLKFVSSYPLDTRHIYIEHVNVETPSGWKWMENIGIEIKKNLWIWWVATWKAFGSVHESNCTKINCYFNYHEHVTREHHYTFGWKLTQNKVFVLVHVQPSTTTHCTISTFAMC